MAAATAGGDGRAPAGEGEKNEKQVKELVEIEGKMGYSE
jgi:hypothetical protein